MDSYGRKEPTRTIRKKVVGLNIPETDSYSSKDSSKEPTGTGRKKVFGFITGTTDSYGRKKPTRTVS